MDNWCVPKQKACDFGAGGRRAAWAAAWRGTESPMVTSLIWLRSNRPRPHEARALSTAVAAVRACQLPPRRAARERRPVCRREADAHDAWRSGVLGEVLDYVGPGPKMTTFCLCRNRSTNTHKKGYSYNKLSIVGGTRTSIKSGMDIITVE